MKALLFLFIIIVSTQVYAGAFINYSLNYHSETDGGDTEEFSLSRLNNSLFLGASMDSGQKYIIGTNFISWNKTQSKGDGDTEKEISLIELGPKFLMYFSQARAFFVSLTYNFYSRGTGTVNGDSAEFNGSGLMGAFGYHMKVSKRFAMGASLNYHSTTITSSVVDNTESDVSDTYVSIYPMIEMVLRY